MFYEIVRSKKNFFKRYKLGELGLTAKVIYLLPNKFWQITILNYYLIRYYTEVHINAQKYIVFNVLPGIVEFIPEEM